MLGMGSNLSDLKERVRKASDELGQIEQPGDPIPELIDSTNLLRQNEYLVKVDAKKSDLLAAYDDYSKKLEEVVTSLLSIQADLRDIIRTEAELLGSGTRPRKTSGKTKKAKK